MIFLRTFPPNQSWHIDQDTHSTAELRFALLTVAKTWDATVMAAAVARAEVSTMVFSGGLDHIFGTMGENGGEKKGKGLNVPF